MVQSVIKTNVKQVENMAMEILKSFGTLQSELEQAKNSLKGVDENIKRLIGRDPSDLPPRPGLKRPPLNDEKTRVPPKLSRRNYENDEPPVKRRNTSGVSVFKRLSEKPNHDPQFPPKQMISKVIVTPKEIPSREEALEAQSKDERFKARNRRMFGALLGTLQKFQQEETKLKKKEEKRAQLERKIEEHEIKEKEEIKKERQELFLNRRKKQAEIKMIELKMLRMKDYATWEQQQRPKSNFITTKTKPHICYLPRKHSDATKELLAKSKKEVDEMIEKKRQSVLEELQHIEDRMKRNFNHKFVKKDAKGDNQSNRNAEEHCSDHDEHFNEVSDGLPPRHKDEEEKETKSELNGQTFKEEEEVGEEVNEKEEDEEEQGKNMDEVREEEEENKVHTVENDENSNCNGAENDCKEEEVVENECSLDENNV